VKRQTDVTSEILATGEATFSQIAQMFETDPKTLPQRCKGVIPAGKRNGYKVYKISEIAARLVKPGYEIEKFIKQMSPQELPPLLSKEFWNGQKARIAFEREMGNYWPTEEVVAFAGVLQQAIRQTLILVTDDVDREEGFTDGQRKVFRRIMDDGIRKMKENVKEAFEEYHANRSDDRDEDGPESVVHSNRERSRVLEAEEDEEIDI
jgi:hypothetical protein